MGKLLWFRTKDRPIFEDVDTPGGERRAYQIIQNHLVSWNHQIHVLRIIYVIVGMAAISCNVLVTFGVGYFSSNAVRWISLAGSISLWMLLAFGIAQESNRMRRAWRLLNTQMLKYEAGKVGIDELINAYNEAEGIIGDVKETLLG
jgi:hypothetical protein